MDDRTLDRVFVGSLKDLPPLNSKIVRIFTSSTFTDMSLERNTLMEDVYPKIKEYCKERHGLEFQVVDMRWGVRDEATDDHMTTELCMKEIENCQRLSMGPNFVAFLGQKYGYRPIPTLIDGQEFRLLRNSLEDMGITEAELLDIWYNEDTNAVPSVFILQPISSILVNFVNKLEPELQARDQSIWWKTLHKLQKLLRIGANHLFKSGKLSADVKHNYMMSVTEREITNGILKVCDVKRHCLAYFRHINKIDMTNIGVVEKFIDLTTNGDIDKEAQTLLNDLRDKRLIDKIHAPNLTKLTVEWSGKQGLSPNDHFEYLREFSNHFYNNITKLVRKAMRKEDRSPFGTIIAELLHHSHSCNNIVEVFLGREKELEAIKRYITSDSQLPLVLHGCSGCGKTSLLAKAATLIEQWSPTDLKSILILRFIGTTPDSSSVIPILISICQQISYNFMLPIDDLPDDLIGIIFYFKQLLVQSKQSLYIFIDSIDQLSGNSESGIKLSWLIQQFPPNVKIVVSCSSDDNSRDFELLNRMIEEKDQFIEVKPLGSDLAIDMIKCWLKLCKRDLTLKQWQIVDNAIQECSLPIFAKLVFAEVVRWKSYSKSNITIIANTVMDSIMKLFDCIEVQHGKTLVSHALSYITASKNGLSESELEDLLSLDDIVLDDVYQYHLPPVRRIPPLLWTRIRNDLPNYLNERDANGVNAMNWYHKQFREASIQRYFQTESIRIYFHSSIADYFLGVWGGGLHKPFKYTFNQKQRFNLTDEEGKADRKVPTQPLAYFSIDGRITRYNLRKLEELPFHLIRAKRFADLIKIVLFDYNWLHSKLNCFPLQSILSDFEDSLEFMSSAFDPNISILIKEISLLADTLRLSAAVITQYPNMIGPQILARLLPLRHKCPNITSLLEQCDEKGAHHCALLPVNHCLHTPGGPLMYSLEGHEFAVFDFSLTSDFRYVVSVSNRFLMWDLSTGEISRDIDPHIKGIMQSIIITNDDKFAITYTNYNQLIILNIISAEVSIITTSDTKFDNNIIGIALAYDRKHFIAWTCNEWIAFDVKQNNQTLQKFVLETIDITSSINLSDISIVTIEYVSDLERHMIYEVKDNQFFLETITEHKHFKLVEFKGGFALNSRKTILFFGDQTGKVSFLRRRKNKWSTKKLISKTEPQKGDELLSLTIYDDKFLVAFHLRGFYIWTIGSHPICEHNLYLQLPKGVRNITSKPLKSPNSIIFTKFDQYAIAGVRKSLYIWSMQNGDLLKSLEAHYGRISQMKSLIVDQMNAIVTSSFDKSIKVWNVKNLFEHIHTIDRMELSIDSISFSDVKNIAITVTRNCIGIWSLETAKLLTTLSDLKIGAILTHALITKDGNYIISTESGNFLIWSLEDEEVIYKEPQNNVKKLLLADNDTKVITIEELVDGSENNMRLTNRLVPEGKLIFQISYFTSSKAKEKMPVITKDNQYIVIPTKESIGVYRLQGDFMHDIILENIKFSELIAMQFRGKEAVVGLIGTEFSYILDIYTKRIITKITRWNGQFTSDGKYGLFTPSRGGLELIDLRYGSTVKVLLPQTSEGVISMISSFTSTDEYVYYYHSIKKTIRLIRLEDGKIIANYKISAEAKVIKSTPDGKSLVVGGVDGNLFVLMIADTKDKRYVKHLNELSSRLPPGTERAKNPIKSWKMAAKLATIAARNSSRRDGDENNSKLCILS